LSKEENTLRLNNPEKFKQTVIIAGVAISSNYLLYGQDGQDDNNDAFRHSLWSALMSKYISPKWAKDFSDAHEMKNLDPNSLSSQMDHFNNNYGIELIKQNPSISGPDIYKTLITAIENGRLKKIKNGKLVPTTKLKYKKFDIFKMIKETFFDLFKFVASTNKDIPKRKDLDGRNILHRSVAINDIQFTKYVMETFPSLINNFDNYGDYPIHVAVGYNNIEIINLLKPLSDLKLKDRNGNDVFFMAEVEDRKKIIQLLKS
jgi:hypothetical protein